MGNIHYINTHILCVCLLCVCLSVCLCLFVNSVIFGTGRCSTMLFSPAWIASPGELRQLLFELAHCVVWAKKALKLFASIAWTYALHVTTMQYLRNWSFSWKRLSFFAFNWSAARKKNVFADMKTSLMLGGSCGIQHKLWHSAQAVTSSMLFTSKRLLLSSSHHTARPWWRVGAFSPLSETRQGRRKSWPCGRLW